MMPFLDASQKATAIPSSDTEILITFASHSFEEQAKNTDRFSRLLTAVQKIYGNEISIQTRTKPFRWNLSNQ